MFSNVKRGSVNLYGKQVSLSQLKLRRAASLLGIMCSGQYVAANERPSIARY